MADWRCPHCAAPVVVPEPAPDTGQDCPHCGRAFTTPVDAAAETVPVEVVDATGRRPRRTAHTGRRTTRGPDEERTVYVTVQQLDGGCGWFSCGCFVLVVLALLAFRGCLTLF